MERTLEGRTAVITGNSRGIGRGISLVLAESGKWREIIGCHSNIDTESMVTAERTRQEIESRGVAAISLVADIAMEIGRKKLLEATLANNPQKIDLILNAAGGLGKSFAEAKKANYDAQMGLVDEFSPHMLPGGTIVYVTSLWAHRYGEAQQFLGYDSVAETKHMAEMGLRARIPEFSERGIRLIVVSGHMIPGTQAYGYFMAINPEAVANLEKTAEGGKFATVFDMGKGVRDPILNNEPSGKMLYVGGKKVRLLSEIEPVLMDQEAIAEQLPMYSESKRRISKFESGKDPKTGVAEYVVKPEEHKRAESPFDKFELDVEHKQGIARMTTRLGETEGHFIIDDEPEPVYRGVDLIRNAAKAVGLTWQALHPDSKLNPIFMGGESFNFDDMVFPNNRVSFYTTIKEEDANRVIGDCEVKVGETVVARMSGIEMKLSQEEPEDGDEEEIEAAAQALVLNWKALYPSSNGLPIFAGGKKYNLSKVSAGDKLTIHTAITASGTDIVGDCIFKKGDEIVSKISGIQGLVLPNMDMAQDLISDKRYERKVDTDRALAAENVA